MYIYRNLDALCFVFKYIVLSVEQVKKKKEAKIMLTFI